MKATVRRESVAGYATDETLTCGPKGHAIWRQRYRGSLQGQLYRLILNSCLCHFAPQNSPYGTAIWPVWQASTARLALSGRALLQPAACQPVGHCAHSRAHRSLSAGCGACRAAVAGLMCGFRLHVPVLPRRRQGCAPGEQPAFRAAAADACPGGRGAAGIRPPMATLAVVTRPAGRLQLVRSCPRRWRNGAGRGRAVRKTPFVYGFLRHFFCESE